MNEIIRIVDYRAGNIASVINALGRLGGSASLASRPAELAGARKLIFPGVGHARPAMEALMASGMHKAIREFTGPVLGICLGMQLMAGQSEEGETPGLHIFDQPIRRFGPSLKVPHMGWNNVFDLKGPLFAGIPENTHFYFVHSYYMPISADTTANCHYGLQFAAAATSGNHFGVQFHPEKSGEAGMQLLKNFIGL